MSRKNTPKVAFSENLEKAIKSAGMSKKQLAEKVGIKPQALTKYFKGRLPGGEILMKMCAVLDVSADFLLGISQKADEPWQERAAQAEQKLAALGEVLPLISKANSILSEIVSK